MIIKHLLSSREILSPRDRHALIIALMCPGYNSARSKIYACYFKLVTLNNNV